LAAAVRIVCGCAVGGISRRQLLAGATAGAVVVAGCGHRNRAEHRVIASVTPYATEYVRFGTGLMVDEDDVDAAVAAVRALT
jgi:hypothetical protein